MCWPPLSPGVRSKYNISGFLGGREGLDHSVLPFIKGTRGTAGGLETLKGHRDGTGRRKLEEMRGDMSRGAGKLKDLCAQPSIFGERFITALSSVHTFSW